MKKPQGNDVIVVLGIILILLSHAITNYMVTQARSVTDLAGMTEEFVEIFEAAPLTRLALQFKQYGFIFQFLIVPGFIGGAYYAARRKLTGTENEIHLYSLSMTMFLLGVMNFTNDFSIMLASIGG